MTVPQFVDVSAFNPATIDWQAYKVWAASFDGVSRVAMRSSYGVGYTDAHFAAYRAGALAAGIDVIIMYHYAYPQYNTPYAEANSQYNVVGTIRPQDRLILDFEENVDQATSEWAYNWLSWQEENYRFIYSGILPGIYASSSYIQQRLQDSRLAKYPLWYANWQYSPDERPACPSPWSHYDFIQYTDRATHIPGIAGTVDADVFLGGDISMQTYGPGQGDFDQWFTLNSDGPWTCKLFNTILLGGNQTLYSQISIDGKSLPIIGLPRTNELYQTDSDGYQWSVQFFERGLIVYDPAHRKDSQPGMGNSYLGKYAQFILLDPAYQPQTMVGIPATLVSDIDQIASSVLAVQKVADSLPKAPNLV